MGVNQCDCDVKENDKNKLPEKVEDAIERIIKKEGFKDYKVFTRAISTDGGNYFGSLYEVDVKGETEDGEKETNIFVKGIVPGDHLTVLSVDGMFSMELFIYNELSVMLNELQNEYDVPANERFKMVKSYQESIHEAILLENVAKKGYKTGFRMDPVSLPFAQLSVKQMAKLHALSFVLEKKHPDFYERKIKSIRCPFEFNDDLQGLLKNSAAYVSDYLNDDARRRFIAHFPKMLEKMPHYWYDEKYKRTIVHGDYRANNILMKEVEGEVVDVIPVDYQLLYYGCPVVDFLYFIFLGTDQEFRKQHLEDLKNLYFDSVKTMLKYFNIDVKSVFPREDFEELYREVLDYGLLCFVTGVPFIFGDENAVPELDKDCFSDLVIKADPRMHERARGIIDDYIQWGIL